MRLNAATLQAAADMGLNKAHIEEYINDGGRMSAEMRDRCDACLKIGQMQGDMTDEEYIRHSQNEPVL